MKPLRRIFTFLVALPNDLLIGWPAVLLVWLFWSEHLRWEGEALVCQLKRKSWPARSWYRRRVKGVFVERKDGSWQTWGGTTLGHAIFYGPARFLGGDPQFYGQVQQHEHVHVEQCEVSMLQSLVVGLAAWACGYLLMGVTGWTTAWLRGEDPYRGSTHEESAYAQTDGTP
jgi:hypothetical protein